MDKNKQWTDSLPELLDGYTEAAPEGLWDAVQAGLQPRRRRVFPLWWIAGPLAAAAAVVLAVVLWPETRVPEAILPIDQEPQARLAQALPEQDPAAALAEETELPVSIPAVKPAPVKPGNAPVMASSDNVMAGSDRPSHTDNVTTSNDNVVAETENVMAGNDRPSHTDNVTPDAPATTVPPLEAQIKRTFRGNVQLALLSGGSLSPVVTLEKNGFGLPAQPGIVTRTTDAGLPGDGVNIFMVNRNKTSTLEAQHSQLTRFQFSVHYRFLPRWGTETGLVFSRLQSRYESTSGQSQSITKRQVNYLGIPLYLHYNVLQWNRLSLYLQAGPMYEITTDTPSTTYTYIAGTEKSSRRDNTYIRDDIWSLNANAGLQLRLFRHGAVFVQPGFSWHLAGENNLETYYTAHPAAFSLSLGYRVLLY